MLVMHIQTHHWLRWYFDFVLWVDANRMSLCSSWESKEVVWRLCSSFPPQTVKIMKLRAAKAVSQPYSLPEYCPFQKGSSYLSRNISQTSGTYTADTCMHSFILYTDSRQAGKRKAKPFISQRYLLEQPLCKSQCSFSGTPNLSEPFDLMLL